MNGAISYFQNLLPVEGLSIQIEQYGEIVPVHLTQRKISQPYALFIVPEEAPLPIWGQADTAYAQETSPEAATWTHDGEALSTFVRLKNHPKDNVFASALEHTHRSLYTEACQLSVEAASTTVDHTIVAQERFCNSIGTTLAFKQNGLTHEEYMNMVSTIQIGGYDILYYSEPEYNAIPPLGPILE